MMTNNSLFNEKGQLTETPVVSDAPQKHSNLLPKREFSSQERVLIFVSMGIATLCDRLLFAPLFWQDFHIPYFSSIFCVAFLLIFYVLFWVKLKTSKTLWLVAGFTFALCVWNIFYDYNSNYGILTMLVIPSVIMAHMVYSTGEYKLNDVGAVAIAWLSGWLIKPFSAIPVMFGAMESMTTGTKKDTVRKVVIGILCTLPLLFVIIPLLGSADLVFGHYLQQLLNTFNITSLISHIVAISVVSILAYSFLWNIGYASRKERKAKKEIGIDAIISCIVLGSVVLVYILFCIVQFTYLFAGAGLPTDMTYSEYAREGFAQIIVICTINLCLFGIFLQYGKKQKLISGLLIVLLCLSCVMLVSSFMRLNLYITTYGMTWLRLLSMWFIVYLTAVILLSFVKLFKEKLPLIAVSALILLGWYATLGYTNPDSLIIKYNLQANNSSTVWLQENHAYISGLSDNAILALLDEGLTLEEIAPIIQARLLENNGYSISSRRLQNVLSQYEITEEFINHESNTPQPPIEVEMDHHSGGSGYAPVGRV